MKAFIASFRDLLNPFDPKKAWVPYTLAGVLIGVLYSVKELNMWIFIIWGSGLAYPMILGFIGLITLIGGFIYNESKTLPLMLLLVAFVFAAIFVASSEAHLAIKAILDIFYLGVFFHYTRDNIASF